MQPQAAPAPTAVPQGQVNPVIAALLRQRAMQGGVGMPPSAGTAPNAMGLPGAAPMPPNAPPRVAAPQARAGANPASAVMKAAGAAQSPLVADQGTRALAKQLISKLLQHM